MTSLYRALNDAAFELNLNKNQLLVTHALMNQTLGYGKISDPLTDKRLSELTGIRLDRLRPAINMVVKKGLFDRKPHKRFNHEYSIGKTFLEAHQGAVFTPAIPKNGSASEKKNPITRNGNNPPEKATHTITNPTLSQPQQPQQTKKTTQNMTYSNQQPQPPTTQSSVKLCFAESTQIPDSFAIETSANTRIEFSIGNHHSTPLANASTDNSLASLTQSSAESADIKTTSLSTPQRIAVLKKLLARTKSIATTQAVTNTNTKTEEKSKITTTTQAVTDTNTEKKSKIITTTPAVTDTKTEEKLKIITTTQAVTNTEIEENSVTPTETIAEIADIKIIENSAENLAINTNTETVATTTATQVLSDAISSACDSAEQDESVTVVPIPLPKAIDNENANACQRHFQLLNRKQQKKVVLVFNHEMQKGRIKSTVGYFITLAKAAKKDELTVPSEAIAQAPPSPKKLAKEKEQQRQYDLWSKFSWLQDHVGSQELDLENFAKQMGMEEAYDQYHSTLSTL